MKNCTSLEQAKKLVEFLSTETADMCYNISSRSIYEPPSMIPYNKFAECFGVGKTPDFLIPCWSFTALFSVLPKSAYLEKGASTELCRITLPIELISSDWTLEPVDACVDAIIKLHEQNLL